MAAKDEDKTLDFPVACYLFRSVVKFPADVDRGHWAHKDVIER